MEWTVRVEAGGEEQELACWARRGVWGVAAEEERWRWIVESGIVLGEGWGAGSVRCGCVFSLAWVRARVDVKVNLWYKLACKITKKRYLSDLDKHDDLYAFSSSSSSSSLHDPSTQPSNAFAMAPFALSSSPIPPQSLYTTPIFPYLQHPASFPSGGSSTSPFSTLDIPRTAVYASPASSCALNSLSRPSIS
ncbi:hypothetical protein AOQ84DRAFT_440507 [Glonium stellatum]|uniref:Uncharacterized protein n=1 Tax=Glonium stellatum TaxID=574774 RepID=A0A8E2JRK6_9PEZI|nr:hypothetical protein AOQ84DRAFT_440507 [Glonium stellatum]